MASAMQRAMLAASPHRRPSAMKPAMPHILFDPGALDMRYRMLPKLCTNSVIRPTLRASYFGIRDRKEATPEPSA